MTDVSAGVSVESTSDCAVICTQIQGVLTALRQHRHVRSEAPLVKPHGVSSSGHASSRSKRKLHLEEQEREKGDNKDKGKRVVAGGAVETQAGDELCGRESGGSSVEIEVLIRGLVILRERMHRLISDNTALSGAVVAINLGRLLQPFLSVVTATKAGAAPTGVALSAVHKILSLRSLCTSSTGIGDVNHGSEVLVQVVDAVIHCNFQQTDTGADEIAIMWILEVLKYCVQCPAGRKLSDQAVWNIISTMYQISAGTSNADMLRGMATRSLGDLLQNLFARVFLPTAAEDGQAYGHGLPVAIKTFEYICTKIDSGAAELAHMQEVTLNGLQLVAIMIEATVDSSTSEVKIESCEQIVDLIQKRLLRALLEICQATRKSTSLLISTPKTPVPSKPGGSASYGSLEDSVGTGEDGTIEILGRVPQLMLTGSLRIVYLLFAHRNMRKHLKSQMEAFFNSVFFRVLDRKITSQDEARIVLETLLNLLADPVLTADLYVNYDCDLQATDVFQNLFKYLSRYTLPLRMHPPKLSSLQLLSLQCIMYGIRCMADRGEDKDKETVVSNDAKTKYNPSELLKRRNAKRTLTRCADMFNRKPREGIQALKEAGLLEDPVDPGILASFLRKTPGLDKVKIGQFLGEGGELNAAVLAEFVNSFEMKGQSLLEALRMFLESFRLPGEAQQIDRVLQCFAEIAHEECEAAAELPTADCAYLLSFSIIMLNTDLHNPNIRPEKKMSLEQFIKNNTNYGADTNRGKDLDESLLKRIYEDIKQKEINNMAEGSSLTAEITPDKWRDLVSSYAADLQSWFQNTSETAPMYDEQMLSLCWNPAVAAMSVIFDSGDLVEQPLALSSAQDGFILCSRIASRFEMCEVIDSIAVSLCKFTSLLLYAARSTKEARQKIEGSRENGKNHEETTGPIQGTPQTHDATEIQRDRLGSHQSVVRAERRLESHTKSQVATVFAFALATKYGSHMRKAWAHVTYCLLRLVDLNLISDEVCLESEPSPVNPETRFKYHDNLRIKLVRETLERAKKEKERTDSGVGWFSNWLFGETPAEEAILHSDEHYALLSAVRIAESSFSDAQRLHPKQPTSPESAGGGAGDASPVSPRKRKKKETVEFMRRCRLERFVKASANLSDEALACFVEAMVYATRDEHQEEGHLSSQFLAWNAVDEAPADLDQELSIALISPPSKASTIFGLHLLIKVSLLNVTRLDVFWESTRKRLVGILRSAKSPTFRLEKATIGLLKIATSAVTMPKYTLPVIDIFAELLQVKEELAPGLCALAVDSLKNALFTSQNDLKEVLRQPTVWQHLASVVHEVSSRDEESAIRGFELATFLVKETPAEVRPAVRDCMKMLMPYVNRAAQVGEREGDSEEALALVFGLHTRIGEIYQERGTLEARTIEEEWIPLLREIAGVVANLNKAPGIRFSALNLLKTALMDVMGESLTGQQWAMIFDKVLFTLSDCAVGSHAIGPPSEDLESANARAYGVMVLVSDVAKRCHKTLQQDLDSGGYTGYWNRLTADIAKFKSKFPKEVPIQLEQLSQLEKKS